MSGASPLSLVHAGEADRFGGWSWRDPDRGEHFRRCSYCGSMHPEDLVTIARGRVEWADRKYGWPHKFYAHVPNVSPDALFCTGSAPAGNNIDGYVDFDQLTDDRRAIVVRDGMMRTEPTTYDRDRAFYFGTRPEHFGKIYTVHLADPALTDEVREQAASMCGLRFDFTQDGRITWAPADAAPLTVVRQPS